MLQLIRLIIKTILSLIFIAFLSLNSYGESSLPLSDYFDLLKQNHPYFKSQDNAILIEKNKQTRELGQQDWLTHSHTGLSQDNPIQTSSFSAESQTTFNTNWGLQKTFWKSGNTLNLDWSLTQSKQHFPDTSLLGFEIGKSSYYYNQIGFTYTVPLLRNKSGILNRLGYDLAQYDIDVTTHQSQDNIEQFLLEMGTHYLDWVLLTENKKILSEKLFLSNKQYAQIKRKRQTNLVREIDVLRAHDAVLLAKQRVLLTETNWRAKQAFLASITTSDTLYIQTPGFDLYQTFPIPDTTTSIAYIKENSPILTIILLQKDQLSHQKTGLENQEKPSLDLQTSFGLKKGDESFHNTIGTDQPEAAISLTYQNTLKRQALAADLEKIILATKQLTYHYEMISLNLDGQTKSLLIQIKELETILTLNKKQLALTKNKTMQEIKLYEQGRGDFNFVIQAQDSEANSKLALAENAAMYHKLWLQYKALAYQL